jgi:hypothetical protein
MATFVAGDVGKFKELRIGSAYVKALITAVNVGGSTVSYIPQKRTTDPGEIVGAPVSNAAFASIDTQADWPSGAHVGVGTIGSPRNPQVPYQRVPGGPTQGVTYP